MASIAPTSQGKTVQLSNQWYEVDVVLVNGSTEMILPTGIINDIVINDSLYSVFSSGYIVINSTGNAIDSYVMHNVNEIKERLAASSYAFNTDSRDSLHMSIKPVGGTSDVSEYNDSVFKMSYIFFQTKNSLII